MKYYLYYIILILITSCQNQKKDYLNISNSVAYVGMNKCAACHQTQYDNFINTGMGKSMRPALGMYSSGFFDRVLHDSLLDLYYYPHLLNDSLYVDEYQIHNGDTTHFFSKKIDYIVGSGHHTNSHLFQNNGYLYQAPFTYYTQNSILDFPPGFKNDDNSRFSRKMGIECIACHNAYPDFVLGSENKYTNMPTGIDCERCHGPGELHVENIKNGNLIDTNLYIDYTIVNPADLSNEMQNDLCARCHLQGNAVLKPNKSFFDFLPGMYLKDIMDVYLPRYMNNDNEFIMASHVDRMKLSACYIKSEEKLSCLTCHDPHVSVHQTSDAFFNSRCLNCHIIHDCTDDDNEKLKNNNDCVSCHMVTSNTTDIPHVTITDHKIAIHVQDSISKNTLTHKQFIGLECVNNDSPDDFSLIQAYLQQYERFNPHEFYLDSALIYLNNLDLMSDEGVYVHIYYLFLRGDYDLITVRINEIGIDNLLSNFLIHKDYSNKDAWTSYRIGESFMKQDLLENALLFYQQAVILAPYNLEFRNKYAICLFEQNKIGFAIDEFNFILNEDNSFVSAYGNLGYIYFMNGDILKALENYNYALKLDPYHEKTLINKAELLLFDNKPKEAFICIQKLLHVNPDSEEGLILLNKINEI